MAYLQYGLVPDGDGTVSSFSDPSYTVRACNLFIKQVAVTTYDEQYHTYYQQLSSGKWEVSNQYYFGGSIPSIGTVFSKNQENWVYAGINQGTLNTYTQLVANEQNQYQLETGIPVNNNANGNYDDGISIPVSGTVQFETVYNENLLQGSFGNPGTFYIQMALWDLPGTAVSPRIDLSASTITFSSSNTLDPSQTVTIPFDSPELEIPLDDATTQDHLWRINRNVLIDQSIAGSGIVDLTSLKRIKFNIVSVGGTFVFKTGSIKMVPNTYSHNYANVNTKTGVLERETWPTISQDHMPVLIQDGLTVKDFTYISKINFKSLPTSGTTEFSMFGRVKPEFVSGTAGTATASITYPSGTVYPGTALYPVVAADTNAYLRSKLLITANSVKIILYEDHLSNLDNEVFDIEYTQPLATGDYFFVTKFVGDRWESILYSAEEGSSFPKETILETGLQRINNSWLRGDNTSPYDKETGRGYAGYQLKPDEVGGFSLDYIYTKEAVLAEYESKTFNSYTPVKAVTLFPTAVPDIQILSGEIEDFIRVPNTNNLVRSGRTETGFIATPQNAQIDDVVVEPDTSVVYATKSLKVTKKEDAKIAAVQYRNKLKVNDFSKLIFKTKIRYNDLLNVGDFRIVFWDESRSRILYIQDIPDLVPNEWNDVDIPLYTNILFNNQFILEVGHYGEIEPVPPITDPFGYFWLEDTQITLESVEWEASNNDGLTYVPFLNAINGEYKSINFASQNYYTSIINKNPYILWEFNDEGAPLILPKEDQSFTSGEFITTSLGSLDDYLVNTPGILYPDGETIGISGTAGAGTSGYFIPTSVQKFKNNKAVAVYGGTESYMETAGTATLGQIFNIGPGSASDITGSVRFYSDTINNKINLLSCEDGPGTALNSWNFSINNGTDLIFESNGVGTLTATVPTWNDQDWHTACFTYESDGNILSLYWDGDLVASDNLASDLIFDYKLRSTGPTATVPHNTYNSFNANYPFIFIDNLSIHKEALDQKEINRDYIAAVSEYNKIKVRARAYTTNAWIYGYELIPQYAKMGRLREIVSRSFVRTDGFTATDTSPYGDGIIFDQAIFDVSTFGND